MSNKSTLQIPKQWIAILAFGIIYIVWGANFVAIRFAIESIPPFLMAGTRFFIAGLLIYLWMRFEGETRPSLPASVPSIKQGIWLNVLGTGGLVWSEQYIPSGLAAIVLATLPVWMVILERGKWRRNLTNPYTGAGLGLGIMGVVFLTDYDMLGYLSESSKHFYTGLTAIMLGTICWAKGSLFSKTTAQQVSLPMSLAIQMITAGVLLYVISLLFSEHILFSLSGVTSASLFALAFLIVFGSVIGYLAYLWLLREYSPVLVGTYAYVHPLVAVFLGWLFADEPVTKRTILSLVTVLGAVFLIRYAHSGTKRHKPLAKITETYDSKNLARNCTNRKG